MKKDLESKKVKPKVEKEAFISQSIKQKKNKVFIEINVKTEIKPKEVYICGNIPQFGDWSCVKSLKISMDAQGLYKKTISVTSGMILEFKILKEKNWNSVEKDINNEEIENHSVLVKKSSSIVVDVLNWAK